MFIVIFIIILGILVLVHELGHFFVARKMGVRVEEFGIGIPPRIFGKEIRGTLWSFNALPIGGFVKLFGEEGEHGDDPSSFSYKTPWARMTILFAGVLMNFILAWVLFSFGLTVGFPQAVSDGAAFQSRMVHIVEVFPDSPASKAGLVSGDRIFALQKLGAGEIMVENSATVKDFLEETQGESFLITIQRGRSLIQKEIIIPHTRSEREGLLGVSLVDIGYVSYPWYRAPWEGLKFTAKTSFAIVEGLRMALADFFTKQKVSVDIAGPVGIAVLTKQAFGFGVPFLVQFVALISLHLAILNIIPFPALDGGRMLFVFIETMRGVPLDRRTEQFIHAIGFAVLVGLIILITMRDISRLL